jgi:hypothetical protein
MGFPKNKNEVLSQNHLKFATRWLLLKKDELIKEIVFG